MKKFIPVLKRMQLFSGVSEEEIITMLPCLDARLCIYKKGEYVFRQGEHLDHITFNRQQLSDFLSVDQSAMSNLIYKRR